MLAWRNLLICLIPALLILLVPTELLQLTLAQHRLLAIFVLAALLWVFEPIPVYATSILIMALLLLTLSNAGISPLIAPLLAGDTPQTLKYTSIFNAFSSPIIILFLGGFALAAGASKYELDLNLARVLLRPFGDKPVRVMLGLMLATGIFSMFMSNTATTVMMLSLLTPVLAGLPDSDPGAKGMVLAVPFAANIGGMGTPIGTPPNAIALQYLSGEQAISFGQWMAFGVPLAALLLLIAWLILRLLFPFATPRLALNIDSRFRHSPQAWVVYITFALTIGLWLTEAWHGMNAYVVAILPLAVFTMTRIITKEDLRRFNWDVIWLVAGGIAIGDALQGTGLATALAAMIDYSLLPVLAVLAVLSLICYAMANFMSNTATANLILPIGAAIATTLMQQGTIDDSRGLLVVVALSASMGMVLPVSTPPNALAYATGRMSNRDMAVSGLLISGTGMLLMLLGGALVLH